MFKSWRLGQVLGFPVEINLSFILLLAVVLLGFGGLAGVFIVGLAFGSVLLHELGHALVARRYGVQVSGIELSFFGGAAKMVQMPRSANHEIAIAAAGPAVSLALCGLGYGLAGLAGGSLLGALFLAIGKINFWLAAFNLIPALPMDGGRILRAALTRKIDFVRATDIAVSVSRVVAISFGVIGLLSLGSWFGWQLVMLAPLLWMMGSRERMLARTMADQYAGFGRGGVDVFPRGGGPFAGRYEHQAPRSSQPYPPYDRPAGYPGGFGGLPIRRFTIRQVGGRLVVEALD